MKNILIKTLILFFVVGVALNVSATIKCANGKPGDTVSCQISGVEVSGVTSRIKVDSGLTFDSCDVCDDNGGYSISLNEVGNFKFKIDSNISESKTLNVTVAGESASISVEVEETDEDSSEKTYSVTLIPGNGNANITKSCTVNSLNTTCDVTLDNLDIQNFNGWGKEKGCTEGAKGTVKVNKDITYYACYKIVENQENTDSEEELTDSNLLLKSLTIKNGEEEIDFGFSIRIKEYDITVPTSVESLTVDAVAQDENVEVVVSGNELNQEENKIIISLIDKEKNKTEYIINVKKSDEVASPLLSNLIVGGYSINFNPNTFVYSLAIDDGIKELNIEATPDDEAYLVEVVGNENLKNGSQINVIVTNSSNNDSSTYVIKIEQATSNLIIYIGIGLVLLIILIILLVIVVKKGKKNNNQQNKGTQRVVPKGKPVNSSANIPEVNSTMPTAPVSEVKPSLEVTEQKSDIEILDL